MTAPITLRFDRLDTGELVALHTHEGRTVAAIVHPYRESLRATPVRAWSLAGDLAGRWDQRPRGQNPDGATSCEDAARALGVELGIEIAGWSVETLDEAKARARG